MGYGTEVKTIEMAFTSGGDWTWPWLAPGGVVVVSLLNRRLLYTWVDFESNQKENKYDGVREDATHDLGKLYKWIRWVGCRCCKDWFHGSPRPSKDMFFDDDLDLSGEYICIYNYQILSVCKSRVVWQIHADSSIRTSVHILPFLVVLSG